MRWPVPPTVLALTACTAVLITACTSTVPLPDLGGIYSRAAQHHDELRNPVIVIPGILGSKLVDEQTGRVVWGAFSGRYANPQTADGARLVAHPMGEGAALASLRDAVQPAGALDRLKVSLLGLPIELDAYLQILGTLGVGGYRDEGLGKAGAIDYGQGHYTCFQFAYDWRRDCVENAARLHEFILERRQYVLAERARRYGHHHDDVKFDIIAHSMGGLIARYYQRYGNADLPADGSMPGLTWAGAQHVDRIILIGTPNAGSVKALRELVEGVKFAPLLPKYDPAVIGTMPSVYQLLPRPRHGALVSTGMTGSASIDFYDPGVWDDFGWGLLAEDQDRVLQRLLPEATDRQARRRIARDHLAKCLSRAKQFAAALDVPATAPPGAALYLFAGDAQATPAALSADSNGRLSIAARAPGDGTVLRSSALMDERLGQAWQPELVSPIHWAQVMFLFTDHLGVTKDPAFTDNVLHVLLEQPRR